MTSQRATVSNLILRELTERANEFGIIKAQGTSREAELIGNAMRDNPGFVELQRIEQAQSIAKALANSTNRVVLSADSLLLNLVGGTFDPSKAMEKQKNSNMGR